MCMRLVLVPLNIQYPCSDLDLVAILTFCLTFVFSSPSCQSRSTYGILWCVFSGQGEDVKVAYLLAFIMTIKENASNIQQGNRYRNQEMLYIKSKHEKNKHNIAKLTIPSSNQLNNNTFSHCTQVSTEKAALMYSPLNTKLTDLYFTIFIFFGFIFSGKVTNIPETMIPNQFGIVGLLTFIRAAESDPSLVSLALGQDLTALGLNLNSPDNLYLTFAGPWADTPCR